MKQPINYCGFIKIIGRSNVGKSTLINCLLGKKISITSCKPQTTRSYIIGVRTESNHQAIYIDTPGLRVENKKINYLINRITKNTIHEKKEKEVELIVFVVNGINWTSEDKIVLNNIRNINCNILLVINKIDLISKKEKLLPYIQFMSKIQHFYDIIPISAKHGININILSHTLYKILPKSEHYFPKNYVTYQNNKFTASEIIREKLMRFLGDELPYCLNVKIDRFIIEDSGKYNIHGLIYVNRNSQKKIIIGKQGKKISIIGTAARHDMENIFKRSVFLTLWIKVLSTS